MKALMYHYVRNYNNDFPFSKYKDLNSFTVEITKIQKSYSFLNLTEATNLDNYNDKVVILTFDDGLKDHLHAAEILKGKGINATFYISINPFLKKKLLHVHKAHLITSKFGPESINLLDKAIENLNMDKKEIENIREKELFKSRYKSQIDNYHIKNFKKIINYYGALGMREKILDEILISKNLNIDVESFYLNEKEIKYISSLGFEIGSHGVTHNVMSRLSIKEQFYELQNSKHFLERIIQKPIDSFCYPYGRKDSYTEDTIDLLKKNNYKNAISVDYRDISYDDLINNIFEIPRYDCNSIDNLFFI